MQNIKTKVLAASAICAAIAMSAHQSDAEEKFKSRSIVEYWKNIYVRLDVAKRDNKKVTGFNRRPKKANVIGAGIGYKFFDWPVRMEFDVQRSNFSVTDSQYNWLKTKTKTSMFNVYRDFTLPEAIRKKAPFAERFIPYVMGGFGTAKYGKIGGVRLNEGGKPTPYNYSKKRRAAWKAGLGIKYCLDNIISLDIGCKYVNLGSIPAGTHDAKVRSLQWNVSVLMSFW